MLPAHWSGVPEGRNNVAHHGSGGYSRSKNSAPLGRHIGLGLSAAPTGLFLFRCSFPPLPWWATLFRPCRGCPEREVQFFAVERFLVTHLLWLHCFGPAPKTSTVKYKHLALNLGSCREVYTRGSEVAGYRSCLNRQLFGYVLNQPSRERQRGKCRIRIAHCAECACSTDVQIRSSKHFQIPVHDAIAFR